VQCTRSTCVLCRCLCLAFCKCMCPHKLLFVPTPEAARLGAPPPLLVSILSRRVDVVRPRRRRRRPRHNAAPAPPNAPPSRTSRPQRRFRTPTTWVAMGGPRNRSPAARREYRRPSAGVQLTLYTWPVRADTSGCCPSTMHTIPRLVGARIASCHVPQHAAADGIVGCRVTPLDSQAQGSMTSLRCCDR
jgi:hypothetical protein